MTAAEPKPYSREWFVSRIGEQAVADGERLAWEAPDPSPEAVERLRRIFAPSVARLTVKAAQAQHTLAA